MMQILTVDDFQAAEQAGHLVGVIDAPTSLHRVHRLPCTEVHLEHFIEKVVENNCRNGHYEQYDTPSEVPRRAVGCRVCKP